VSLTANAKAAERAERALIAAAQRYRRASQSDYVAKDAAQAAYTAILGVLDGHTVAATDVAVIVMTIASFIAGNHKLPDSGDDSALPALIAEMATVWRDGDFTPASHADDIANAQPAGAA